jgi:hypothetical protein
MAPSSANDRQLSFSLVVISFSDSGVWRLTLTPSRANGWSFSFSTSDRSWGQ